METDKCIKQRSEMNKVDCFGCVAIQLCLENNPSAKKLDGDERDMLIQSIPKPQEKALSVT